MVAADSGIRWVCLATAVPMTVKVGDNVIEPIQMTDSRATVDLQTAVTKQQNTVMKVPNIFHDI